MPALESAPILVALIFVLAGAVKGVIGMGLPTVSIGLLGLVMTPAEAAALVIVPSLVTNLWQFAAGRGQGAILRRAWPMLLAIALVTAASAGLIAGGSGGYATEALGAALIAYAVTGLARMRIAVARERETWLGPLIGAATGIVTGATGVFVLPAVPYLQALGLERPALIQALGLSFTVSTVALAAGLAGHGAFHLTAAGASALCTVPALAGMSLGQWLGARIEAATFRRLLFAGLLLLGLDLVLRAAL